MMMMLKKDDNESATESNPTQKYRQTKGISKRVNIQKRSSKGITSKRVDTQIIKDTDTTEQNRPTLNNLIKLILLKIQHK
jgi:hypothetical protein